MAKTQPPPTGGGPLGPAAKADLLAGAMALPADAPPARPRTDYAALLNVWIQEEGPWWLCSFVFHMVLVCSLALVGTKTVVAVAGDAHEFTAADVAKPPEPIKPFDMGETPEDPTELTDETLTLEPPGQKAQTELYYDDNPVFIEGGGLSKDVTSTQPNLGGMGGFEIKGFGPGPAVRARGGGVGNSVGDGGFGFGGRGQGHRKAVMGTGGATRQSERAVAAALHWLARHQMADGSWNLSKYVSRCKDATCTGPANADREIAATALGLLPYLGAGQTHHEGTYKRNVGLGINYLIGRQKADGSFNVGLEGNLYDHGLASITLCECYGMTGDPKVGKAAQAALDYIMASQDLNGGGWRYQPHQPGDTSVTGWQVMALKSGQMAGLIVKEESLAHAKRFLESVSYDVDAAGAGGGFGYLNKSDYSINPGSPKTLAAVGLLCTQYLGASRTDPAMTAGTAFLMDNLPLSSEKPNIYYWYYATQVMHNQPGRDWDDWNRAMRHLLINTQSREGCAQGSWDPRNDQWGVRGGRLMQTSLSALTLEVYYRYLPLYKLDRESAPAAEAQSPAKESSAEQP